MKNLIFSLIFFLISSISFSQSIDTIGVLVGDTSVDLGIYINKIDLIENRIDTLITKSKGIFTIDSKTIFKDYESTINFYEYDNVLVLNSESNIEKKIIFLNFLYEYGSLYTSNKYYTTENGEKVMIYYETENEVESDKKIKSIFIFSNKTNEYCTTYGKNKK